MSPTVRCSFVGSAANSVLRVGLSLLKVLRVIDRRSAQSESACLTQKGNSERSYVDAKPVNAHLKG